MLRSWPMRIPGLRLPAALVAATLALAVPTAASAQQTFESVGVRALGMAGAFVAVADDASAVYWNPAGLATAGPVGVTIEWNQFQIGDRNASVSPGPSSRSARFLSLGTWPLGLFYGRLQTTAIVAGADGQTVVEAITTSQFGGTVLQTLVPGLVVGSTLRFVRGSAASGPPEGLTAGQALDSGVEGAGPPSTAFDLDVGVMADLHYVRVGLTARNLRTPTFTDRAGNAISLPRQARLGLAVLPADGLTLAMDVDLDTVGLRDGLRRIIALGGEDRLGSRFAVRGGVRWNLEGNREPVGAVGVSLALHAHVWVDAELTRGGSDGDRGFGIGLRAGY